RRWRGDHLRSLGVRLRLPGKLLQARGQGQVHHFECDLPPCETWHGLRTEHQLRQHHTRAGSTRYHLPHDQGCEQRGDRDPPEQTARSEGDRKCRQFLQESCCTDRTG